MHNWQPHSYLPIAYLDSCLQKLKTAIVRGLQLTTPSSYSYDVSCFLLKIAIVRGPQKTFLWRILLPVESSNHKETPIDHPIPIFLWHILFPVGDSHGFGQNTPIPWPKYQPPMVKIPPSNGQNIRSYVQNTNLT